MQTIWTSRYANPALKGNVYTCYRISCGKPSWDIGYDIAGSIDALIPYGIMGEKDKAKYEEMYFDRLNKIGVGKIGDLLKECGKDVVLLCFEDIRKPGLWCHRRMFADWWLEKTGLPILELRDMSIVAPDIPKPPVVHRPPPKVAKQEPEKKKPKENDGGSQMRMF